jgi:hypothetical protein
MSTKCIARQRVQDAQKATDLIDRGGLWNSLQRLQDAGRGSNGAGVFCDISRLKGALSEAAAEIARAQKIMAETQWPSDRDYDEA